MPDESFEDRLVDYLAGELEDEDAFEEELFGASDVGARVAAVLGMQDGIAILSQVLGGGLTLTPILPQRQVDALRASGRSLLELEVEDRQEIGSPMPPGVELFVAHLRVPEAASGSLDLQIIGGHDAATEPRGRFADVPWDPDTRRLTIVCERHMAERDRVTCFRLLRAGEADAVAEFTIRTTE